MNPLDQFNIHSLVDLPRLLGFTVHFTNSTLSMMIAVFFALVLLWLGVRNAKVVPSRLQSLVEIIYNFVALMIRGICGDKGLEYIGLIFTVFIFILFCNLVGMLPLPMSFTATSQIIVTFAIALLVFFFVIYVSVINQGWGFFSVFLPAGTPLWLAPLMIVVEIFTYLFRPVSLSVRLSANMIAGHTILKVIAGFVTYASLTVSPLSFIFVIALVIFEVFVAMLQAYIFAILTCVYLSDSFVKH